MSIPNNNGKTDDVEVSDPDDYTTRQRLKQIYQARKELRAMRQNAATYRRGSSHRQKVEAVQHYRTGVESYLLELDTLLRKHDPGPELWSDRHYGTITVKPPGKWTEKRGYYVAENVERRTHVPLKVKSVPDPKDVDVIGLKWLFETETPVSRSFEFTIMSSTAHETTTRAGKAYIGWNMLNKMVTDVNAFLGELGIGLDTDNTDEWKI